MNAKARWTWSLVPMLLALPLGLMHLHLVKSLPEKAAVVTEPTTEIRLWFNQKPEAALSTIALQRSDSTAVPTNKVTATDDSLSIRATLAAPLAPGTYLVRWKAVGRDGHPVRGTYTFTQQ